MDPNGHSQSGVPCGPRKNEDPYKPISVPQEVRNITTDDRRCQADRREQDRRDERRKAEAQLVTAATIRLPSFVLNGFAVLMAVGVAGLLGLFLVGQIASALV